MTKFAGQMALMLLAILATACAPRPSEIDRAEAKVQRLMAQRFTWPMTIQSVSVSEGGSILCGYAMPSGPPTFQPLQPFVVRGERLILLNDDPVAFEAAQRRCGPDWVSPRIQPGIP